MARGFDAEELRAAEALDSTIDAMLSGHPTPPDTDPDVAAIVRHLAVLHQAPVPDELREIPFSGDPSVVGPVAVVSQGRALHPAIQWSSGALGVIMLAQALTLLGAGEQLARFLHLQYVSHVYHEQGLMALAIGFGLVLAAFRKTYLPGAVAIGGPLGLLFGVYGLIEIPHSPNPAAEVLHFIQAGLAGVLTILWMRGKKR